MSGAVVWSGGKDSALALQRAVAGGLDVRVLFNLYDGEAGRVRFHGVRRELIAAQADALGFELLQLATRADDFERVFLEGLDALRARGVHALVFGNIHLADVRAWYEERTTARGFEHVEPLWGMQPAQVLRKFVYAGFRARITCVDASRAPRAWLGAELDEAFVAEALARTDIDAAGERGEYHTYVHDGPLFRMPVRIVAGEERVTGDYAQLDLMAYGS